MAKEKSSQGILAITGNAMIAEASCAVLLFIRAETDQYRRVEMLRKELAANLHQEFESLLARQERRSKALRQKTNTPLNAMFRGVFRLYLLTSPTPQMSFLADFGVLRAVSLATS